MPNFTDPIYSDAFVAKVNEELASNKTALQMWSAVYEHLHEIEGVGGLDTVPREYLLMLMDHQGVRGFHRLARRYGYMPRGKKALDVDWVEVIADLGETFDNLHHYTSL